MILLRKALRDVRAMGPGAVLLILVIGVGVGMPGGIALALDDVRATRDAFYQDQRLADLDVRLTDAVPSTVLTARATAASATVAETRLVLDGSVSDSSGRVPAEVVGMSPDARLDRLAMDQGQGLAAADPMGAVVETGYAQAAGIGVGDTIPLTLDGKSLQVHVRGLATSPEYLLATADPKYLIPQPGSLAVIFLPLGGLGDAMGAPGLVNDLVLDLPAGSPPSASATVAAGLPVSQLIPRSQQYSLRFTNADLQSFALFVPVLEIVFAAVGLILLGLSLRRMVHAQRRELGTMLAIGYSRPAVLTTVILPAALLAIPGALVALVTAVGIAHLVAATYSSSVGFPAIVDRLEPGPLAQTAGLAVGATLLAATLPAWMLLRLTPAAAMRGDPAVHFGLPGPLRRATAAMSPPVAYALRSLGRQPLLTGATVASLAAAIGLGAAMSMLATSTNAALDAAFATQKWTAEVDLAQPMPVSSAVALAGGAGATAVEPVVGGPAQLGYATHATDVMIVGLPSSPALDQLRIISGAAPQSGQLLVSEQTAETLDVGVGDQLQATTAQRSRQMVVAGIVRTLASGQSFVSYEDATSLFNSSGDATAMYVTASPAAARSLAANPQVARVTSLAAARDATHKLVADLTDLIYVLLVISLAVGGLFLAASLALSFLDRQGEFATLRALGYGRRGLAIMLGTEAVGLSFAAAIVSLPASLVIATPLADAMGHAWFRVDLRPVATDFALAIPLALALSLLVAAHATRRVLRMNIATAVRARSIG
jgi:putative ABC transport system permease protein